MIIYFYNSIWLITLISIKGYGKIKTGFKCAVILKVQLSKNQIYYHQYLQEFDIGGI